MLPLFVPSFATRLHLPTCIGVRVMADIMNALSSRILDFEDAVAGAIAKRIKAECIVTRNTKDFSNSPVPATDPKDFLAQVSDLE